MSECVIDELRNSRTANWGVPWTTGQSGEDDKYMKSNVVHGLGIC